MRSIRRCRRSALRCWGRRRPPAPATPSSSLSWTRAATLFPEIAAQAGDAKKAACQTVREDGAYIEAGENDNLIVQKLEANPALGIFGYSFLEQNGDKLWCADAMA